MDTEDATGVVESAMKGEAADTERMNKESDTSVRKEKWDMMKRTRGQWTKGKRVYY